MDYKKIGSQTLKFNISPVIISTGTVVGPKEGLGPLAKFFDKVYKDTILGEKSFEKAECKMLEEAARFATKKVGLDYNDIDFLLSGDLLNQIITSSFCARTLGIPYIGLFGACSTMAEGLSVGAALIDGGFARRILVATSSHNCCAERQYRYPTEYGGQRPPYAQWTVTGAGAVILAAKGPGPRITSASIGKVLDYGIKDPFDMGSAMAPAAAATIMQHFKDTGKKPEDYDLIITGDLGATGKAVMLDLLSQGGYNIEGRYTDSGLLIYYPHQQVDSGGSGCACSAVVWFSHIYRRLSDGEISRVLLVGTGSLHSPTTYQQGESMPGIAHAVSLEV